MNKSFSTNNNIVSVNGIFEQFYAEVTAPSETAKKLSALLIQAVRFLTSAKTIRMLRAFAAACSLVGLIGIVGAIEVGNISPLFGLILASGMIAVEYLCLRPRHHKS